MTILLIFIAAFRLNINQLTLRLSRSGLHDLWITTAYPCRIVKEIQLSNSTNYEHFVLVPGDHCIHYVKLSN